MNRKAQKKCQRIYKRWQNKANYWKLIYELEKECKNVDFRKIGVPIK